MNISIFAESLLCFYVFFLKLFYECSMIFNIVHEMSMFPYVLINGFLCLFCGYLWTLYVFILFSHGVNMFFMICDDCSMMFLWSVDWISIVFPWLFYDCSYIFPIVFLLFSMVTLWCFFFWWLWDGVLMIYRYVFSCLMCLGYLFMFPFF